MKIIYTCNLVIKQNYFLEEDSMIDGSQKHVRIKRDDEIYHEVFNSIYQLRCSNMLR